MQVFWLQIFLTQRLPSPKFLKLSVPGGLRIFRAFASLFVPVNLSHFVLVTCLSLSHLFLCNTATFLSPSHLCPFIVPLHKLVLSSLLMIIVTFFPYQADVELRETILKVDKKVKITLWLKHTKLIPCVPAM